MATTATITVALTAGLRAQSEEGYEARVRSALTPFGALPSP